MNLDFRELFHEHAAFAWRSLMSFGLSSHAAEDACQEAFLVVHQKLEAGFVPEQPKAWIYGICWRVAAQHRRRKHVKRELAVEAPEIAADSSSDPARLLEDRKRLVRLDQALEQLSDDQRAVFVLYEIEQLAMREVSEALGCPLHTAFSRLYSARRKVAAQLGVEVSEKVWKQ